MDHSRLSQELNKILEGPHSDIIRKVKKVISSPEFAYENPHEIDRFRETVLKWCKILANEGFGSMAYPISAGGGNDMHRYFTIMETLSYHDLSMVIKFGVQFGLFGMSIFLLGTEKHHQKYLRDIGSLELPGSFAMTETGHGSNVRGLETTAIYNHEHKTFTVHTPNDLARKTYIGNAACHAQAATVFAKLIVNEVDHGVCAFVVPLRDKQGNTLPGVRIEDCGKKMGLNGVDNGRIWFDQVVIPSDNLLDKFVQINESGDFQSPIENDGKRFFTMLGTLVGGRIGIPKSALSAAKSGLTIAIKYASQRRQFGQKDKKETIILDYKSHQRRLLPLLSKAYALHFSLEKLAQRYVNKSENKMREIEALAAGLKAYSTWNTTATLQECREACGGKGFLSENRIAILKNDSDIYTTFEGDNTVLMQLVAKSRLGEYKEQYSDIDFSDIVDLLINEAKINLTELNPVTVRNTNEEHLLDFEFHLDAFKYRENSILKSSAKRVRAYLKSGINAFDAFNNCQSHLINVGMSFTERIILEDFIQAISKLENGEAKKALTKVCQLYALFTIEQHKGWYLEQDYMKGIKTKAIRRMVDQLCFEIKHDALDLINAFEIPDNCLSAPIAFSVLG